MSAPPRYHPLARILICGVGLLGIYALFNLLTYVGATLLTVWAGHSPQTQSDLALQAMQDYSIVLLVLNYIPWSAWIIFCRTKVDDASMASLGLHKRGMAGNLARGILGGAMCIGFLSALLWLSGCLQVSGWNADLMSAGAAESLVRLLGWLLVFALVGFMEELVFRGYFLKNLELWIGWRGALITQAVVFGLIHLNNVIGKDGSAQSAAVQALPSLMLIGVFFGLAANRTGSLWFPIGFHWAWNFFLGCVFSLPVSGIQTAKLLDVQATGPTWLTGGPFGAEASLLLPAILVALIAMIAVAPTHPQTVLDVAEGAVKPEPEEEPELVDENRENRFRTRFNQTDTFDADTLNQLREMQDQRRREIAEAQRREKAMEASGEGTASFAPEEGEPVAEESITEQAIREFELAAPIEGAAEEAEAEFVPPPVEPTAVTIPERPMPAPVTPPAASVPPPVEKRPEAPPPQPVEKQPATPPPAEKQPAPAPAIPPEKPAAPGEPPKKKPPVRW